MQVSVETTTGLERKVTVQVPSQRIDQAVEERLKEMTHSVRLAGFRPGKVPVKVVRQRYGPQVRQEVLGEVLQSSLQEAIVQEQLRPAGAPHIEPLSVETGKDLEYTATFEVYPELKVGALEKIEIERPVVQIGEADVDRMIDKLRQQRTSWEDVDRPSKAGDRVTVDFEGRIDGEPFEGNKGERVPVELGKGGMLADFEAGLTGAKAGETCGIEVRFPDDYHGKAVAGKTAQFEVRVHTVSEPVLPEIDDAFVASFGVSEGGVEALRAEARANMQRELDQTIRGRIKQQVMDGLLANNEVEVPKALVDDEVRSLQRQAAQSLGQPNMDLSQLPTEPFEEDARRRVQLGLMVGELVRAKGLQVDKDRVRREVETIAASYDTPGEVVKYYYGNPDALRSVEGVVLEDQVVELVLQSAKVSEVEHGFDEIMNSTDKTTG
jgi:trigger factor